MRQLVVSRQIFTAGADMKCGTPIYLDANNVWQKAAADGTMASNILTQDAVAGNKVEGLTECNIDGFSGLTVGGIVYLADSEGVTQTQPTIGQILGKAVSTTEIEFDVEPSTTEMTGATGLQGITGLQGYTGVQGRTGLQGGTGSATGVQGITGLQGITGADGLQGITGEAGLQGITGEAGLQGTTGEAGLQGVTGEAGLQGITGLQGTTGANGIQGITGALGGTQATGIAGITGAAPTANEYNVLIQALKDALIMGA